MNVYKFGVKPKITQPKTSSLVPIAKRKISTSKRKSSILGNF